MLHQASLGFEFAHSVFLIVTFQREIMYTSSLQVNPSTQSKISQKSISAQSKLSHPSVSNADFDVVVFHFEENDIPG